MLSDAAHNPFDAFFRQSLERPEILQESCRQWLPKELVKEIDLDSLEIVPGTFIDEALRRHQSDVLVQAKLLIDNLSIFFYILFEHKTQPDRWVGLQVLRYMVHIWEKQRAQKEPLTPVIPIVFYHGERRWNISTEFQALFNDLPAAAKPHLPNFNYILQDYAWRHQIDPDEIEGNIWYRSFLAASHTIFDPNLPEKAVDLVALIWRLRNDQRGIDYFDLILYYWVRGAKHMTREALTAALDAVESGQGEKIMATLADMWIEQGIEKGSKALQSAILNTLNARFGNVSPKLQAKVMDQHDLEALQQLVTHAALAPSLAAFEAELK